MDKRVRVGMIGTSWYADSMHLPSLTSHPQAEVTAICGRNLARGRELAAKFGIAQVYDDYRAMMESGQIDAVVIATPDDQHYAMTLAALEAGLHVVCEKPLALDLEQARTMAQRADAAGVKHMVFFTLRWFQHTQYLKELVDGGYLGRPTYLQLAYIASGARAGNYRWRYDGDRANGILGDLGSHLIDLARLLNGEITRVAAQLTSYVPRLHEDGRPAAPANDSAVLLVEYANGAQGVIQTTGVAQTGGRGLEQALRLYGLDGTLEVDFRFGNFGGAPPVMELRGAQAGDASFERLPIPPRIWGTVSPDNPTDVFNRMPAGDRYFIDCIVHDRPVTSDFWEGVAVQAVIDAAKESHRTGRWVEVAPLRG